MLFNKNTITYSPKDAIQTLKKSLDRIETALGDKVYVTNSENAVITHRQLMAELHHILNGSGKTSTGLISAQINLDLDIISPLVKEITAKTPDIYMHLETILCRKSCVDIFYKLKNKITQDHFVNILQICKEESLDMSTVQWACGRLSDGQGFHLTTFGDYLVETSKLKEYQVTVLEAINSLDQVTDLKTLQVDDKIPKPLFELIIRDINSLSPKLKGSVDKSKNFIPDCVQRAEQKNLLDELKSTGVVAIDIKSIKGRSFMEVIKSDTHLDISTIILANYMVTNDFVDRAVVMADELLGRQGWLNLLETVDIIGEHALANNNSSDKQILVDRYIIPKLTCKVIFIEFGKVPNWIAKFAITRQLIKDQIVDYFANQAVIKLEAIRMSISTFDGLLKLSESRTYVLTREEIKDHLMNTHAMPNTLADQLVARTIKETEEIHNKIIEKGIEKELKLIKDQQVLKLSVYLLGVQVINEYDSKTGHKLYMELRNYAQEKLQKQLPDDINEAFEMISNNESAKVNQIKEQIEAGYIRRLQKTSKPDEVLLAVILYLFCRKVNGALRATGKFIPKLLSYLKTVYVEKESEALIYQCTQLKEGIASKVDKKELKSMANQLKATLLSTKKTNPSSVTT